MITRLTKRAQVASKKVAGLSAVFDDADVDVSRFAILCNHAAPRNHAGSLCVLGSYTVCMWNAMDADGNPIATMEMGNGLRRSFQLE